MKLILNSISLMILVVFATSCATKKKDSKQVLVDTNTEVPNWVYNIDEACNEAVEICASAEGSDISEADLNAKNSLASIFETKIKSNFSLEKYGFTSHEAEAMTERVQSNVSESVDTILNGASIKERFSKDNLHFSLAVLDKKLAKKSLRIEIKTIDDQLNFHMSKRLRSSLIKMHLLLNKRNLLNEKYVIVSGSSIPTDITYSKINSIKYQTKSGDKISVKALNTVPRTLVKRVETMLTEVGYKIVKSNTHNYLVRLKYHARDEYLNVKGFRKFSFSLEIDAKNAAGTKLGTYTSSSVSLGRNKQDAFLKIKNKLIEDIRNNIEQLNIK